MSEVVKHIQSLAFFFKNFAVNSHISPDDLEMALSPQVKCAVLAGAHRAALLQQYYVQYENLTQLAMVWILSSRAQGCKDFLKTSKPCHAGIHWLALAEYSLMSTHMPGFHSFSRFLHHWHVGTHLIVLSKSYPMNTKTTWFRWFSKSLSPCSLDESRLSIGRVKSFAPKAYIFCRYSVHYGRCLVLARGTFDPLSSYSQCTVPSGLLVFTRNKAKKHEFIHANSI